MSRAFIVFLLATTLASVSACEAATPPAKVDASKTDANKTDANKPDANTPDANTPAGQNRTPAVVGETSDPAASGEVPAWFDANQIEHEAIVNQMASKGAVAGGQANALILELAAGTSAEQCGKLAREVLAKTIPDVAEATASDDGRVTISGKTDGYHYMIVCGDAKGTPTMYLSYTTQVPTP